MSKIIRPSTLHFVCFIIDAVGRAIIFVILFLFSSSPLDHIHVSSMEDEVHALFLFHSF